MAPATKTVDEILDLVDNLPSEERRRLLAEIRARHGVRFDPMVEASFEDARRITAKFKGSLADDIIADRKEREI